MNTVIGKSLDDYFLKINILKAHLWSIGGG